MLLDTNAYRIVIIGGCCAKKYDISMLREFPILMSVEEVITMNKNQSLYFMKHLQIDKFGPIRSLVIQLGDLTILRFKGI